MYVLKQKHWYAGAQNAMQLKEIEDKIIHVLSSSEGNILEDQVAIDVISSSKALSNDIAIKQQTAEKTERRIDDARSEYASVANFAAVLFFTISELANVEPMYQYSLAWFVAVFRDSVKKVRKISLEISVAVFSERSLRSPRKLFIFIIKEYIYRIKVP